MINMDQLLGFLKRAAPMEYADEGDPVGLHVGRSDARISRICVTVDTSPPVIDKAIEKQADILVAHHPLIYRPLASLTNDDPVAACVIKMIRANCAVWVMHTNYDTAPGGINDVLAEKLGVFDTSPLTSRWQDKLYKVCVYVPGEAVEAVRKAMAEAGAGHIGNYSDCSFRTPGTGTYLPLAGSDPYAGEIGRLEEAEEFRLETICPGSRLDAVLKALLESHPYEEAAYDIYELANEPIKLGYGRVGSLKTETTLGEFAQHVRSTLELDYVKVGGDAGKPVKKVALCGGGGSSLYKDAANAGADVYVTGDLKHHDILNANALGLAIIDAGHFDTEKPGMVRLAERLNSEFGEDTEVEYIE